MTASEWALTIYLAGVGVSLLAALVTSAEQVAKGRLNPADRLGEDQWWTVVMGMVMGVGFWPVILPGVAAYWAWRGLVAVFVWRLRRVNDRLTHAPRVVARQQREDES